MFERVRRFSRTQPLRDGEIDFPRFMILIHVIQRAGEAGLIELARDTLAEAERLRAREHGDVADLKDLVIGMRGFIGSLQ